MSIGVEVDYFFKPESDDKSYKNRFRQKFDDSSENNGKKTNTDLKTEHIFTLMNFYNLTCQETVKTPEKYQTQLFHWYIFICDTTQSWCKYNTPNALTFLYALIIFANVSLIIQDLSCSNMFLSFSW